MKIELKSNIINDEYTKYVYDNFDIQNQENTTENINYDLVGLKSFDWNIGVIYGGSGTGKTTILKQIGELSTCDFDYKKSVISNFDWLNPKEASYLLSSMGLSSIPTWLRPFHLLSNGEQYRAELAYKVASAKDGGTILIDEYTSVVDRDVAKAMSFALQKYIRKQNKKIILASCHYDIMDWLMPDWTCSPQKGGKLEKRDYRQQGRPKIELQVSRVESKAWDIFKKHHYMSEKVNESCMFFLFEWNDKPIGIIAIIPTPRNGNPLGVAISRIVILPDYQGLGFGSKLCNFIGGVFRKQNRDLYIKTISPSLGEYFNKSKDYWIGTNHNGKKREKDILYLKEKYKNRLARSSYCHKYIGQPIKGYEDLLLPVDKMRDNKIKSEMYSLFDVI